MFELVPHVLGYRFREDLFLMANKKAHRLLQRLVEDEIKVRPKLTFCLRLVQKNPKKEGETKEQWIARIYLENKTALGAPAMQGDEEDDDDA